MRDSASLTELGLDELSAVEVLMHVEEAFGIELSDDDVMLSSTIDGIAKLVEWHLRNKERRDLLAPALANIWADFPND
jgi:acyl carrier protein